MRMLVEDSQKVEVDKRQQVQAEVDDHAEDKAT